MGNGKCKVNPSSPDPHFDCRMASIEMSFFLPITFAVRWLYLTPRLIDLALPANQLLKPFKTLFIIRCCY